MEIGLIGLPNVGKSTLFNALTKAGAAAENYPFTTVEPNVGIVPVPDKNLSELERIYPGKKIIPASLRVVDIAGLVKGAHKGEGLGNQFLSHIREVDAVAHVVRAFKDTGVVNVIGEVNPREEVSIIETELIMADLEQAEKKFKSLETKARTGEKSAKEELSLLSEVKGMLQKGEMLNKCRGSAVYEYAKKQNFITAKATLYVLNVGEENISKQDDGFSYDNTVRLSAKLESELRDLSLEEEAEMRHAIGCKKSGLESFIEVGIKLLNLVTFYTVVGKEMRAWTIPSGTTVQKAAGKIHTDMEKGFIRADVFGFKDLLKEGAENTLRQKGLIRSEGKGYIVQSSDVVTVHFKK